MANTAQSKKRARQSEARQDINKARRSRIRTFLRKVEEALTAGNADAAAVEAMRLLARPLGNDPVIVAGESAVAGVAAAVAACQSVAARQVLGLTADSRILFFGSEAATDPQLYEQLVGESAEAVATRAGARA